MIPGDSANFHDAALAAVAARVLAERVEMLKRVPTTPPQAVPARHRGRRGVELDPPEDYSVTDSVR